VKIWRFAKFYIKGEGIKKLNQPGFAVALSKCTKRESVTFL